MVELIYFFHQLAPILLPVTLLVWGYYFFKQKDTPLLLVSILLVIFSIFFILVLPDLMRNIFMYPPIRTTLYVIE